MDSNNPGMTSGHPGMQPGTWQNGLANGMLGDLQGILLNAIGAPIMGGIDGILDGIVDFGGGAAEAGTGDFGDDTGAGAGNEGPSPILNVTGDSGGAGDRGDPGAGGPGNGLPPDTIVVRGGTCQAGNFQNGTGVWMDGDGNLQGISVGMGNTLEDAGTGIKNGQIGVTNLGTIQDAGGTVVPTPTANNPFHGTLGGLPPSTLQDIFTPTIPNPFK